MTIHGLIPVAGLSSRMGEHGFKPLLPLLGKTVIETTVDSMLLAGVDCVVIVLGHRADEIKKVLSGREGSNHLIYVYNQDPAATDMFASVKIGLQAMPEGDAFFLLPGDMPLVKQETFSQLLRVREQTGARLIYPAVKGHKKHPPLIDKTLIPLILADEQGDGLRGVFRQYTRMYPDQVVLQEIIDSGCITDIDTIEDYKRVLHRESP